MSKILSRFIIFGFVVMLVISTIDLAIEEKSKYGEQPTRITAPITPIEFSPAREDKPVETFEETSEEVDAEIKSITADTPAIDYGVPLDSDVQEAISRLCDERGVDVWIVLAMIYHESRFNESVIGDNGKSFGLMQIQPRWHRERMDRLGVDDLLDGKQNVAVGIDFLAELLDRYDGDYSKALTAYNRGHYDGKANSYAINVIKTSDERGWAE